MTTQQTTKTTITSLEGNKVITFGDPHPETGLRPVIKEEYFPHKTEEKTGKEPIKKRSADDDLLEALARAGTPMTKVQLYWERISFVLGVGVLGIGILMALLASLYFIRATGKWLFN